MTNDVPLIKFMEMRFDGLEKVVDHRLTGVETAVKAQTLSIEALDEKREKTSKRVDSLEGFRSVIYKISSVLLAIGVALTIACLTGLLF